MKKKSFKRWNPLLGEWVIFAPTTAVRPWSGSTVTKTKADKLPSFDSNCYLCPGVKRASGFTNPDYENVYVFDNDYASFSLDYICEEKDSINYSAQGKCRVICFSPNHNLTLAEMSLDGIKTVLYEFCRQYKELSLVPEIKNVMIFENKGIVIGVSNPHPHGQLYATDFVPRIPASIYMKT